MALLSIGDDPWLLEHESCEKLHRDIMEQLSLRQLEIKSSEKYSYISATIRLRLKQYNNEVNQLKEKINRAYSTQLITLSEFERRIRQVELLQSKDMQIQKLFENYTNIDVESNRKNLLGSPSLSDSNSDITNLTEASNQQMQIQQRTMLKGQDEGLEILSKIISRQKNIAQTINTEVDLQNEIIEDLGEHIARTDSRVVNETRKIGLIDRKDKTFIYWVIIILLFISIITVAIVHF